MVRDVIAIDSDYSMKYITKMTKYFSISGPVVPSKDKIIGILWGGDVLTRAVAMGELK